MASTVTNELRELFKKNIVMDIDDLQKQTSIGSFQSLSEYTR
jgi:hypothetical protein